MNHLQQTANQSGTTTQPDVLLRILCSMDSSYQRSKWSFRASIGLAILSVLCLLWLYVSDHREMGAFFALILQVIAFHFKGKFIKSYRKGHEFEREALLNRGLGEHPCLDSEYKDERLKAREEAYKTYFFSSRAERGPRRLLEDIAECSYFTKNLAQKTYDKFVRRVTVAAYAIVGAVFLGLTLVFDHRLSARIRPYFCEIDPKMGIWVEVLFLALGFVTAGELALASRQYGYLAKKMRGVFEAAIHLLESGRPLKTSAALIVLLDYSALLMESPPILDNAYSRDRERLNRNWREGKGTSLQQIQPPTGEETF
jgi:hypothetical protein